MTPSHPTGRDAARPREIPLRGWRDILARVWSRIGADHVPVVSAGVAFFGLLALFPAIVALVSLAGYVLEPGEVARQISGAAEAMPPEAAAILTDQARQVAAAPAAGGLLGAAGGLALALWSASRGMNALIEGMNIAYDERESRGFLRRNALCVGLTLLLIGVAILAFATTVAAPPLLEYAGLPRGAELLIAIGRWPVLAVFGAAGLAVAFRYGPCRRPARWRWVAPGATAATLLWIGGSLLFSLYVSGFASYNETYGALGGVIILLTWLWLSAFIVLLGAGLNAEMEHQTRIDSTRGPDRPMGARGASKADTVAEAP